MEKRPTTRETIKMMSIEDFDGQIDDVIDRLTSLRDSAIKQRGYINVWIHSEQRWDNVELILRGERYLTAEEIAIKIELEELTKKVKLDRERAQYEMLKKKFEGQS